MSQHKKVHDPAAIPPERNGPGVADGEKAPPFGTAETADPGGTVPRVLKPTERAPQGFTRYKVSVRDVSPVTTKYILTRQDDEESARKLFLDVSGIAARQEQQRKQFKDQPDKVEQPTLVVTRQPD